MRVWKPSDQTKTLSPEESEFYKKVQCDKCGDFYHKDEMRKVPHNPPGRYLCLTCGADR